MFTGVARDDPTLASLTMKGAGSTVVKALYRLTAELSPSAVAANTTAEQIFSVDGVLLGDVVFVNKPTSQAGLGIVGSRVSSDGHVAVTFVNATASPITPTASQTYLIGGIR